LLQYILRDYRLSYYRILYRLTRKLGDYIGQLGNYTRDRKLYKTGLSMQSSMP